MNQQQPPYGPPGYPQQGYGPPQPPPKKGMSVLTMVLAGFGVIFVLGAGSCLVCVGVGANAASKVADQEKQAGQTRRPSAAPDQPAQPQQRAQATPVNINTLLAEYKGNEVKGDNDFKGKTIQVTGKVGQIKKDIMGHMYVTVGTGKQFEIPEVQCTLNENNAGAAMNLSKGQTVTVQGEVSGLMMNVLINDCDIL
jgi:hypothetical protein